MFKTHTEAGLHCEQHIFMTSNFDDERLCVQIVIYEKCIHVITCQSGVVIITVPQKGACFNLFLLPKVSIAISIAKFSKI